MWHTNKHKTYSIEKLEIFAIIEVLYSTIKDNLVPDILLTRRTAMLPQIPYVIRVSLCFVQLSDLKPTSQYLFGRGKEKKKPFKSS